MDPVARLLLDPEPLTPAMLGLRTHDELEERLGEYLGLAGVSGDPTEAQHQRVLALIYGARIVVLEGEVEKFRAEGEVTIERDLLSRIARLERAREAARAASEAGRAGGADDFAPFIAGWGVGP